MKNRMIDVPTTVSVVVVLLILSVLIKDNFFYRLLLSIWMGTEVAYYTMTGAEALWFRNILPISTGNYLLIIPVILGALLFLRFYRPFSFFARIPSTFALASNMGTAVAGMMVAQIYQQLTGGIDTIGAAVMAIWVIFIMIYFTTTFRDTGPMGWLTRIGRWMLYVSLGAMFATYAIARYSHVIGRIQFIFISWLEM